MDKNERELWGSAVGWRNSLKETFRYPGLNVVQSTLGGCSDFKIPKIEVNDLPTYQPKTMIFHASHLVNMASDNNRARRILQSTLTRCSQLVEMMPNVDIGCVFHVGRGPGANLERVVEQILSLNIPKGVTVFAENAAGQGAELGRNIEELQELFETLPRKIKLCIDTQHSFGAGICEWSTEDEVADFIEEIEKVMPYRLRLFHLNDSKVAFKTRVDRHEDLFQGYIWKEEEKRIGLLTLLETSMYNNIPMILETPNSESDLDVLSKFWRDNKRY